MKWLLMTVFLSTSASVSAGEPAYSRVEVIYGRAFGTALTMDAFVPKKDANGAAIVFAVSEGWYSDHDKITPNVPVYVEPFVAKGYAVFAVCHGSNPKFALPEMIGHLNRAVRFLRHHAAEYGVDPGRIGATGDSAGAHLALMLGCAGRDGDPDAPDPVDRQSSRVQAVVSYFAPTDFLNWGVAGKAMLGDHPSVPVQGAFDFHRLDPATQALRLVTDAKERAAIGRAVSPITHVARGNAPTLLVHGDKDELIPLQQAEVMAAKLKAAGVPSELIVMPGGGHDEALVKAHGPQALAWFDKYLAKRPAAPAPK